VEIITKSHNITRRRGMLVAVANYDNESFDEKQLGTDREGSKYPKHTFLDGEERERKSVFLFLITIILFLCFFLRLSFVNNNHSCRTS